MAKNVKKGCKKSNQKFTRGGRTRERKETTSNLPVTNDFSWYNSNPALVKAAANLAFPYRPGTRIPDIASATGAADGVYANVPVVQPIERLPGIFAIDWAPSVGTSKTVTSPISLAARDIFSKIRSAYSGSLAADAPDLVIEMLAMDGIYSYIAYLKRLYKTVRTFDSNNILFPEAVLEAQGWSLAQISALRSSYTRLYGITNELVSMVRRFIVPNIMPLFQRHMWMSERYYADVASSMSQVYIFNPAGFYKFGTDAQGAGMVQFEKFNPADVSPVDPVTGLYEYGLSLISALSDWDDIYTINGYMERAYAGSSLVTIDEVGLNDTVEFVFDDVVLTQIENLTEMPVIYGDNYTNKVYQDPATNAIKTTHKQMHAPFGVMVDWDKTRINVPSSTPEPMDVVEASRLISEWRITKFGANDFMAELLHSGTEVVLRTRVCEVLKNNTLMTYTFQESLNAGLELADGTFDAPTVTELLQYLSLSSNFTWFPIRLISAYAEDSMRAWLFGNIRNIAFASDDDMEQIHRICLYSEFGSFGA